MEVKMALGRRIVSDFHSGAEADAAHEAFNREVRQGLEPADIETVDLPAAASSDKGIRVDKLLALIGLTASVTDATRKIKAGAVEINGNIQKDLLLNNVAAELTIRVGKQWKRVKIQH
jgi:tyrosyl-tRNA synthetase